MYSNFLGYHPCYWRITITQLGWCANHPYPRVSSDVLYILHESSCCLREYPLDSRLHSDIPSGRCTRYCSARRRYRKSLFLLFLRGLIVDRYLPLPLAGNMARDKDLWSPTTRLAWMDEAIIRERRRHRIGCTRRSSCQGDKLEKAIQHQDFGIHRKEQGCYCH